MTDEELLEALREHAVLEGDFVLRSGRRSRWYLDKYRFETRPDLLAELGRRLAERARHVEPEASLFAAPELGAVALAAAASLASGVPFLIVRGKEKEYGTANRIEGVFEPGACVCVVEDVVTTGGAALGAVEALRAAGLRTGNAVCVLDRQEGGVDLLARHAVRLWSLFTAAEVLGDEKVPQNRMVEPNRRDW